jgi:putative Holliday junction resolvase
MASQARMAVDVGTVRIGVAAADAGVRLAMPVETVARGEGDIARLRELALARNARVVWVGDPLRLSGEVGPAALAARAFAAELAEQLPGVEVRMLDERLTTAMSSRSLAAAGRNTRSARSVVDQAAAVAILQNALDTEAATGTAVGTVVSARGRGS